VPALTSKDADDLRWALALRADMIALSFVQGPEDAEPPRKIMDEMGVRLPLIAKVEKPQAVAALDEVVAAFDGIMVARGDLGVEYPLEQVPLVQKRAIRLARQAADDMVRQVEAALLEITRCRVGDLVVMVAGSPPGTPGRTNALRVHRIGDAVES
jgi:pyruvate kinase